MKRAIESIVIGKRTRKEMGDIGALARSIHKLGLLHPIVIDNKNQLIAGQRRLKVCESLGWGDCTRSCGSNRRHCARRVRRECRAAGLPAERRYVIAKKLEKRERKAAKERKARPGQARSGKFPQQAEKGKSRDKMGKRAGISGRTLDKMS